jgi:hypothetical protein
MKRATKIVIGTMLTIALTILGAATLPLAAGNDTFLLRSQLAITSALAIMYTGAAILFMISLKAYKAKMRQAFITLAMGILLTAIATVQLPIATMFGLLNTDWAKSGLIIVPFLFGGLIIYMGIRAFARLTGTNTLLTHASVTIAAIMLLSVLSVFLPHDISRSPEIEFDATSAILTWTGLFNVASAFIVLKIRQRIGAHYVSAMTWLLVALAASVFVIAITLLHTLLTPANVEGDAIFNNFNNILVTLVGAIYLRAGYVFTETEDY